MVNSSCVTLFILCRLSVICFIPFLVCQPVSSPLCAPPKLVLLHFRTFSRGMCYTQSTICFPRSISSTIRSWILNWLLYAFCVDYLKLVHAFRGLLTHEFPTVRAPAPSTLPTLCFSTFLVGYSPSPFAFPQALPCPFTSKLKSWCPLYSWLIICHLFNAFPVVLPCEFPTMVPSVTYTLFSRVS